MKVGILGGGQLARMIALAAFPLGIEVLCIDPKTDCSAKQVTPVFHCHFTETAQIEDFFGNVDCLTYETENLPAACVAMISKQYRLSPNVDVLKVTQDRLYEKQFLTDLKIPTAEYFAIRNWEDLHDFIGKTHFPLVLKTRRDGYDGKGQMVIKDLNTAKKAWELMQANPLIAEKYVAYDFEVSLIAVRSAIGEISFYPLTLNKHENGILRISEAPYINDALQMQAQKYAKTILEKFDYIGVMTIEFFCVNDNLLVNEIAPRVHNSGHWTIEGADTSQFENHLRAILGLPLGSTNTKGFSVMLNQIGKELKNLDELLKMPGLHFHTYGKQPMPNRKLGHLTLWSNNQNDLAMNARKTMELMNNFCVCE